jgi:predicted nucleotidyltransferase
MEKREILKVIVGSQAHGLATPESDFDYRGVFLVPTSEIIKLGGNIKNTHWIEGKDDDTSWEIGHFLNLATHCNPTILETFLAPRTDTPLNIPEGYYEEYPYLYGEELRELFPHIWNSLEVYNAFRGYSRNQLTKFIDKKDAKPHKYASAYLRVMYQGFQLLTTGTFPVNFRETPIYNTLVKWKNKEYTRGEVMDVTEAWENKLTEAFHSLPRKEADLEIVNDFLLRVRKENW